VRLIRPKSCVTIPGAYAGSPLLPPADVWDALEHFAWEMGQCEGSAAQKRLTLEAVRTSIAADAAYWYPGDADDAVEVVGSQVLPADWCCAFAGKLIKESPGVDGRLLRSELPPAPRIAPVQPHSAAMVRVSRSQSSWIVALSLSTRRCFQATDLRIMALIRQILVNQRRRCHLTSRMSETLSWLVQCLTTSIDAHLPHAQGHSERVAKVALEIGKRMHLATPVLNDLYFAGLLHDIGITGVPQSVLLKPARLTTPEYDQLRQFPVIGDRLLAGIKPLAHLRPAVRHVHERYDGQGYPDGLSGDDIPLMARILGVADAFDAMRSHRPHRLALASSQVDDILAQGAGTQWDPHIIEHYMVCRPHFHALHESPAQSQVAQNVRDVVEAWNDDSSRLAARRGLNARATPPPDPCREVPTQ
jgi:HD-GYP domain-containing protein (c-di-GMP phosphodiesterase class II)